MHPLRYLTAAAAAAATLAAFPVPVLAASAPPSGAAVRAYAHHLAALHGWGASEQAALDAIIDPESGFDPCAVYPSRHDCGYEGTNSCGIPQATPCPRSWRGRLAETWRAQLRWLIGSRHHPGYIERHGYGLPSAALAFRRLHNGY